MSYIVSILTFNGDLHFGQNNSVSPFKILCFNTSKTSIGTSSNSKSFSKALISSAEQRKPLAKFCLTVTDKNNSRPASISSITTAGTLHFFDSPY